MKKIIFLFFIVIRSLAGFAQDWTDEQLDKANTAVDVSILTADEKEAIMYINLARLYPKEFVQIELEDVSDLYIENPAYTRSLIADLNAATPVGVLYFDNSLYELAKCFAKESGDKGTVGHKRKKCRSDGFAAECCSYGEKTGWDIAFQWLIDDNIKLLAHRKICLDNAYTKIGLKIYKHKKYGVCAVADFGR